MATAILGSATQIGSSLGGVFTKLSDLGCAHDYGPGTAVYRGTRALDPSVDAGTRLWNAQVVLYSTNHYSSITQATARQVWSDIQAHAPQLAQQASAAGPMPNQVSRDPVPGGWIPANVGEPPCQGQGSASSSLTAWQTFVRTVQQNLGNTIAQAGAGLGSTVANQVNPSGNYVNLPTNMGTILVVGGALLLLLIIAIRNLGGHR